MQEIIRKTVSDETFTLRSNTMMDEALKGQYQTPTLSFKTAEDMQTHFNPAQEL